MPSEVNTPSVVALWLISREAPLKPISPKEELSASALPSARSMNFRHSRGYLRNALADLFRLNPLEIPLLSIPGEPPRLQQGWGYVSLSHCRDAILVGWSLNPIGVDLERMDRSFAALEVALRYFSEAENKELLEMSGEPLRLAVLDKWLAKEAAIKWQRGKISSDLVNWQCNKEITFAENDKLGCRIDIYRKNYLHWGIAVATNSNEPNKPPMLCLDCRLSRK